MCDTFLELATHDTYNQEQFLTRREVILFPVSSWKVEAHGAEPKV
jgi:hypothetical protein